ncbi:MAG TPA: aminotransferase class V-fold PLP-dependent enzyme [Pseudolysinimonas sp.]
MSTPAFDRELSPGQFRSLFPALQRWAWFDTPGSPPAAAPVSAVLRQTIDDWELGEFAWRDWDASVETAREAFAAFAGVDAERVAALTSVAEGMATVVRALPPGSVVVGDGEYRSMLYPLLALDPERNPVIRVAARDGVVSDDRLIAAIRDDTVLLAVSDTLTSTGHRVDLDALRTATRARGVRIAADLTQSLGVLDHDLTALDLDYVLVHGYKWLLCPRGTAWLIARPDALEQLRPVLPSWKSTDPPYGYFGGELDLPSTASRLDTSPAWFSWIGANAALQLRAQLRPARVEQHCVGLAARFTTELAGLGFHPIAESPRSHIVVTDLGSTAPAIAASLAGHHVRATVTGSRLRIGVHYFNDDEDLDRLLAVIRVGVSASRRTA